MSPYLIIDNSEDKMYNSIRIICCFAERKGKYI